MTPARAHARLEAGQPWYSIGLLSLSLGLLVHLFAPALALGPVDVREFVIGLLVGLGVSTLVLSLWKQARLGRGDLS